MKMKSARLCLREFREDEFNLLYSVFSQEKVMKYAFLDKVESEDILLPYFQKIIKNNNMSEGRLSYEYAVFFHSTNQFIGFADIEIVQQNKDGGSAEIGYFILPEFWGNGYAAEIADQLIYACFEKLHLHRVFARCNSNNGSSEKVMIKCRMQKEGEFRKVRYKNGRWDDELQYSILLDDWKRHKLKEWR